MTKRTNHLLLALVLSSLLIAGHAAAEVAPAQQKEIAHLMAFIKDSDCLLERNGKKYAAKEALSHIKRKYDYFTEKIHSTEDFIRYSATKSEMSGKYYRAYCNGEAEMKLADWLLRELKDYRQKNQAAN